MSNDSEESASSSSAELKTTSSSGSSPANGGKSSRGPGRPKKVTTTSALKSCTWCADNKVPLKYIINQNSSRKEFCSENCVAEFRNAYRKGACIICDNVIRDNAPHRDYCSTFCLNSDDTMKGQDGAAGNETKESSSTNKPTSGSNNNNTTAENLNDSGGPKTPGKSTLDTERLSPYGRTSSGGGGIFQYEQLNVFDWTVYLKVNILLFSTAYVTYFPLSLF